MDLDAPIPTPIFALFLNNVFTSSLKNYYCTFFSFFKAMCLCLKSFHLLSPGCDTVSLPDCQGLLSFLLKVIGSRVPGWPPFN